MGNDAEAKLLGDLGGLLVRANAKAVMELVESLLTEADKMLSQVSKLIWRGASTSPSEPDLSIHLPHPVPNA
jgi:hypothetical protein